MGDANVSAVMTSPTPGTKSFAAPGAGSLPKAPAFRRRGFLGDCGAVRLVRHEAEAGEPMNGIDKCFAEVQHAQPTNPMFIASLFLTRHTPEPRAVRDALETLLQHNPRLTFCMDHGAAPSRWVPVAVDVADHCEAVTDAEGGLVPDEALDEAVAHCMSVTLSLTERPAWRQYVLPLASGQCAILTYIHHSYSDGQGGVGSLLSLVRRGDGAEPETWAPKEKRSVLRFGPATDADDKHVKAASWGTQLRMLLALGLQIVAFVGAVLLAAVMLPLKGLRIALVRKRAFRGSQRFPAAAKRTAWSRPLRLGAVREVKDALSRRWSGDAGDAHVTINDVMLGVMSSAFAAYMEEVGEEEKSIFAGIPFSFVRKGPTDRRLANFSIILPLFWDTRTRDAVDAVENFHHAAQAMKRDAAGEAPLLWLGTSVILSLLPPLLKLPGCEFLMQRMSVILTNVPGPRDVCAFAGQEITKFIPFAPSPGTGALGIAMISYADSYTVGIYTDATNDERNTHGAMARMFEAKFAELAAAVEVADPFQS